MTSLLRIRAFLFGCLTEVLSIPAHRFRPARRHQFGADPNSPVSAVKYGLHFSFFINHSATRKKNFRSQVNPSIRKGRRCLITVSYSRTTRAHGAQRSGHRSSSSPRLKDSSGFQLRLRPARAYTGHVFPMPINTLIIDDEKPAREELAFLLKGFPDIQVIAQGKNGLEAVSLIKEHSPDLVFLDVQMPGLDGFGVLQKLVERKIDVPHVVFATAFDHYAVQAFDVNAVDYVLKPFDKPRIAKAIQRARRQIESETSPTGRLPHASRNARCSHS